VIKPAYSVSFLLSINIFEWQNVLYFPNDFRRYLKAYTLISCFSLIYFADSQILGVASGIKMYHSDLSMDRNNKVIQHLKKSSKHTT
jgi:hypothetical protein